MGQTCDASSSGTNKSRSSEAYPGRSFVHLTHPLSLCFHLPSSTIVRAQAPVRLLGTALYYSSVALPPEISSNRVLSHSAHLPLVSSWLFEAVVSVFWLGSVGLAVPEDDLLSYVFQNNRRHSRRFSSVSAQLGAVGRNVSKRHFVVNSSPSATSRLAAVRCVSVSKMGRTNFT